ncbi:MAG: amidase [Verrucomicrobia bacterium]|nr:amidase [Verrucomicrobiota bacterium]MBV8486598.1 amidase [Verrucomicrobiota bacterium]
MIRPQTRRNRIPQVLLLALSLWLSGCVNLLVHSTATSDRAFITYWPPPKDETGLRLAVKDLIDLKGTITSAGSEYLAKSGQPAQSDAACLAIARERNVVIVGKTNMSEFAVAPSGFNQYYGIPKNRLSRKVKLIPGGSSSGSAVAVQSGLADVAFGTDTAGSVRVPAACCGVVGLKTTLGLVPLDGVLPIEPKYLDTVGPIARDVDHAVQGMDLLEQGFADRYAKAVSSKPFGRQIRIGRLYLPGTDHRIDQAIDAALAAAQFHVIPLGNSLRTAWEQAKKDGNTLAAAGAWFHDQKYLGKPGVSAKTSSILALGEYEYNVNYKSALRRRLAWQEKLQKALRTVDFIAVPTLQILTPSSPPLGSTAVFEAQMLSIQNTTPISLAGNPALAVPIPIEDRAVPLTSLQLIGPPLSEAQLLNAGRLVELSVNNSIDRPLVSKSSKP